MSRYSRAETTASSFAEADWSLIERIIEAVPAGETGFEAVSAAYDEVMEHAGLDAEEEDRHYRLLLKIHEMKAPTLQLRMDKWKSGSRELRSSVGERTGGTVSLDMLDLDDTQEYHPELPQQEASAKGLNDVRTRVPFLADAGSDPDGEGDDELEQHAYDEPDAETTVDYTDGQVDSETSTAGEADPRMSYQRNSYVTPVRLHQQHHFSHERLQRQSAQQFVPKFQAHSAIRQPPPSPSPEKRPFVNSTPASQGTSATAPSPPIRALRAVHDDEYRRLEDDAFELERVYEVEGGNAALVREMRAKAVVFHDFGLRSRAFREWLKELQYERTDMNDLVTKLARSRLRTLFVRWRSKSGSQSRLFDLAARTHARALQGDAFRRWARQTKEKRDEENCRQWVQRKDAELLSDAWLEWKERNSVRRRQRWEDDMNERELVITEKVEFRVKKESFTLWRLTERSHRAAQSADHQALDRSFAVWQGLHRQRQELRHLEARFSDRKRQRVFRSALSNWRRSTRMRIAEADVVDMVNDKATRAAWTMWRNRSLMFEQANVCARHNAQRRAWQRWSQGMEKYKTLAQISYKIHAEQEAATVSSAFTLWLVKTRGGQLLDRKEISHTRRAFNVWKEKTHRIQKLNATADATAAKKQLGFIYSCLRIWIDCTRCEARALQQAEQHQTLALCRSSLRKWRRCTQTSAQDALRADTLRSFQIQRYALAAWQLRHSARQQEMWIQQRELQTLADHFHTWLQRSRRQHLLRRLEEEHAESKDKRWLKGALRTWVTRVVDNKSAEYDAKGSYDFKILRVAFGAWTNAILRQGEALSLCQSFRDVREEATRHRLFHFWQAAAQHRRMLRRMSEEEEARRSRQILRDAFASWSFKQRDAELQRLAPRIVLQRDDALLLAAFDSWTARSRRLPALAFEKLKMKRKAWDIWRAALPGARQLREAAEQSNAVVLRTHLDQWKRVYRSRVARRASARRRSSAGMLRLRPSTGSEASIASAPPTPAGGALPPGRAARRRSGLYAPSLP